jgi:anthranilate phosphoribosyltransferase
VLSAVRSLIGGHNAPAQIPAFLVALRMQGESVAEIAAAAEVMRKLSTKVPLLGGDHRVDTCGTEGDEATLPRKKRTTDSESS